MGGQLEGLKGAIGEVKKNVADLDEKFTTKFDELSAGQQQIKDALLVSATRRGLMKDIGKGGWAAFVVFIGAIASYYSGAASWMKVHLFH